MTELVDAYQRDDVHGYEKVLQKNQDILADPFIAENIDEVTRNMRTKGVLKLIASYSRMKLSWIAKQLKISEPEVQDILGFLIVDGKIAGKINQAAGTLEIESNADADRIQSLSELAQAVTGLFEAMFKDGDGYRFSDYLTDEPTVDLAGTLGKGRLPGMLRHKKGKATMWP
jgi:COP9 signalosome complex subunit 2